MSFGPEDTVTARRPDDREGLDLFAAAVEEVASDLSRQSPATAWPPPGVEATADRRPVWLAVAAVLAAMILAWPAYLGLVKLPRVNDELRVARIGATGAGQSGPVEMRWLSPPRPLSRAAGEPKVERVERRAGRSAVWLLEVPMDRRGDLAGGARVEVAGTRWGWQLDAAALARQLEAHDGVAILVHFDDLALGPQRLRLIDADGQEIVAVDLLLVAAGGGS